jgi:hypothetical protein
MTHPCDNRLIVGKETSRYVAQFGMPYCVAPMHHVNGLGHQERLEIACYGGFALEVSRAFAIELARRLPEAIASMPIAIEDVHDAVGGGDG